MMFPVIAKGTVAAVLMAGCVGALLGMGGCATTGGDKAAVNSTASQECTPIVDRNIVFHSKRLANDIDIVVMNNVSTGGAPEVRVSLRISPRAKDKDMLALLYKFVWYDDEGKEITTGTGAWDPLMLFGGGTAIIQGVAPAPGARNFKLIFQEAEDNHC
jgi:uncharacterized protein YcfL